MLTAYERGLLEIQVSDYEVEWANTDPDIQDMALDALGAYDIDDAIGSYLDADNDFDLECIAYNWKDLMDVVAHKEHEMGLR